MRCTGLNRFSNKASLLQSIDRFAGIPLCAGLTILRQFGRLCRSPGDVSRPKTILFLKLTEQGSTVLAHDAIRLAVERVGREHVHFLVFEENRFILDVLGLVPPENVLTIETHSAWSMMTSCARRLVAIRRRRIDVCIDMEFFARFSAAISFLTGARLRVGFHGNIGEAPYRGNLHTHRVPYNPHIHTSGTFMALVLALDQDPSRFPTLDVVPPAATMPPPFQPQPEEVGAVRQLLRELGVTPENRLILLNANASDLLPLRRWHESNYVALAEKLLREFPGLHIAFTGATNEADRIRELVRKVGSPRCSCLAGRTTLRQLLVVYGLAEVLVTNDSGPAHFAALTPIDSVVLFGPETPLLYAAIGPRHHPLWARLACSPCVNAFNNRQTSCRDNRCMQAITVESVFAQVREVYLRRDH